MAIVSLQVSNFRCIEKAELEFDARCTAIAGENAAGKTSLLEAISVLSTGRSFRTYRADLLVGAHGGKEFLIAGKVVQRGLVNNLGFRSGLSRKEIRLNGASCRSFGPLATCLPVQVIDPSTHRLLEGGPLQRRRFVDWGVFHVEPSFIQLWRDYNSALTQRNAALKAQQPAHLVRAWDEQLILNGEGVRALRQKYIGAIAPVVAKIASGLLSASVEIRMSHGWDQDATLAQCLAACWSKDLRHRTTTIGAHRADLEILTEGLLAKDRVSRGQQKLLACALILAQLEHRVEQGLDPASLLLDDPAAELDVNNLGKLLRLVANIPAQLIATAVDVRTVDLIGPAKTFHVKQGYVAPMV